MATIPDYIIAMQVDLEEARDFYLEGDCPKMKANLEHLRNTAYEANRLAGLNPPEATEAKPVNREP